MIPFFGQCFLIAALLSAFAQSVVPLFGYWRQNSYCIACVRPSALAQIFCVIAAYALLTYAFFSNDFSNSYVAANSHETLPLLYRLTAVWGAHEGSILLWIVILNLWTLVFIFLQKNHPLFNLTLAMLGFISLVFLLFLFFTSNPFLAGNSINGQDLNPLLQDPGFFIHPPMLYTGYVGLSVAFAITLAALLRHQLDARWAALTRCYAIAAWCFLTGGIALGSWWAYRVLGWGGFWFWDPVENASLLPWLSGTALIHVLVLAEKRQVGVNWAALLSMISFFLSLVGTFLVRSGVLISAHSFANDPLRGVFLLLLIALLSIFTLTIFFNYLTKTSKQKLMSFSFLSREMGLLINSSFMMLAMLTILLGTLYPLILDALHLGMISVGPPYFNTVMLPMVFFILFFMGLAPHCKWENHFLKIMWFTLWKKMLLSITLATILLWSLYHRFDIIPLLTLSLSVWIILTILSYLRSLPGMAVAHFGFAILMIGIMLSSLLNEERDIRLKPGLAATLGPYQFFFVTTEVENGANYKGIRAIFDVTKNSRAISTLYPAKRIYTVRDMVMTKVDIDPGIFRDLYIALGEPLANNFWSVRIYYKPFVRWIWFGGVIMIIGGFLALFSSGDSVRGHGKHFK